MYTTTWDLPSLSRNSIATAISSFDQALPINKKYAEAYLHKGIALFHLEEYEESVVEFNAALKIRPDYEEALYRRGRSQVRLGKYKDAISSFDLVLVSNPGECKSDLRERTGALCFREP